MTDNDRAVLQRFLAETEAASSDGSPTPRFNAFVTDRTVALRLGLVAFRLQDQNTGTRIIQLLRQVATLRVNDVKHQGLLAASGPAQPRNGGMRSLRVPDDDVIASLDRIRDGDPYYQRGLAQYELIPWAPTIGKDALDKM